MEKTSILPATVAACWESLRGTNPLTQCLINIVAAPLAANVLLAAGATPAMVDNPPEAADFAGVADGVLVNLGTPSQETADGMRAAVCGAVAAGTPWILDPIGAGGLPWRTVLARELLDIGSPAIIRGNASEILGLAGGGGGRGPDSTDSTEDTVQVAGELALRHTCVIAVSGPVDWLTDGTRVVQVPHGHPWMTRVTGMGCALGALMAATAAVSSADQLVAATTATAALTLAAEDAAPISAGPGTFAASLLDALANMEPQHLATRVRLA